MKENEFEFFLDNLSLPTVLTKFSFAFLLLSMFLYWFHASFKSNRETLLGKAPSLTMWLANIALALMLSLRWVESGHFPLSNLYESLLFLSWSLTSIHLFLEHIFFNKGLLAPALGAITAPLALFTNAFATFSLPQEMQKVTVLVPALQSNWLIMHVSVMMVSYAALLSGSLLAIAYLVVKFVEDTIYSMQNSSRICENLQLSDPNRMQKDKIFDFSLKNSLANFVDSSIPYGFWSSPKIEIFQQPQNSLCQWQSSLDKSSSKESEISLNVSQQEHTFQTKQTQLKQILDNLSYRSIGLGFALLTIGIFSGAVWANEAWGSYWSWDPKETWAFVTWLIFALYLHTRLSRGWVGKKSAFVAAFGFLVIWFCYLGVNLFGKGLHSYGWFPTK